MNSWSYMCYESFIYSNQYLQALWNYLVDLLRTLSTLNSMLTAKYALSHLELVFILSSLVIPCGLSFSNWDFSVKFISMQILILLSSLTQVVRFANSLIDARNELQHKYVQVYSNVFTSYFAFLLVEIYLERHWRLLSSLQLW